MNLVLFDIDGTLINTEFDDYCYINTFKELYNIDVTNTNWNNYKNLTETGVTIDILNEYLNRIPDYNEIQNIMKTAVRLLELSIIKFYDKIYEIPGANDIIYELKKRNDFIVGLATGCWKNTALTKLKGAKIDIEGLEISHSDNYISKTDIIKNAIENIKIKSKINEFERIFYIGDREYDYKVSNELNIEFIGVDFKNDKKLEKLGINKIVNDFKDKNKFLEFLI